MSFIDLGQGFTRPTPPPLGDSILIVVEGGRKNKEATVGTEPAYFRQLLLRLELAGVRVADHNQDSTPQAQVSVIPHGSGSAPKQLIDRVLSEVNDRKVEIAQAKRDGHQNPPLPYNRRWVVFDTDAAARDGHLDAALTYARENDVEVAASTPCFEFWLYLHISAGAPNWQTSAQAEAALTDALRPHHLAPYAKDSRYLSKLMPWLMPRIPTADKNAQAVRRSRAPKAATAYTDIDLLIRQLDANAAPSRRLGLDTPARTRPIPKHLRR